METIRTNHAPEAIGPYAQAILADGWLFCSGQIGIDPSTGKLVEGGIEVQTRRVLANLEAVLEAAGAEKTDIVRCTIYLVDMEDFPKVNAIYGEWLGAHRPARATVAVAALPLEARVEIDLIARLQSQLRA